jgi:RNA polymerase sigma factor (sigma-70 family)
MNPWLLADLEHRIRQHFPDLVSVGRLCEEYRRTGREELRERLWEWTYYWIVRFFALRAHRTAWPSNLERMIGIALERVHLGFQGLRHPQAYPAWVTRICTNVWYSAHRGTSRTPDELESDLPEPDPPRGIEETIDETELLNLIGELIEALPRAQREIARLHIYYGYGLKEIADRLEMLPGTVRVYWHRVVQHLRHHPRLRPWIEEGTL